MSWVATAITGSALLGAGTSLYASGKQQQATQQASQLQSHMFDYGSGQVSGAQGDVRGLLGPFASMGGEASGKLLSALPGLTASFNPTMSDLEKTPGYQFTLDQGLKATTNANSAMGLANSGVQGKGIANYAESLAGTTFQQQFLNYLAQHQQQYNMLMGPTQLGAQAAGQEGGQLLGGATLLLGGGLTAGGQIGGNIIGGGNAGAAGILGVGASGGNTMNQYLRYMMLQKLTGGGLNNASTPADFGAPGVGSGGFNFLDAAA